MHVVHVQAHKRTQKPQGTVNQKLYFYYRQIKHHFQRLNQKKNSKENVKIELLLITISLSILSSDIIASL